MLDENCDQDFRSFFQVFGIIGSYFVFEFFFFSFIYLCLSLVWIVEDLVDGVFFGQRKKEQWYVGIDFLDGINLEVLEVIWVICYKNVMVECWEFCIYVSEEED